MAAEDTKATKDTAQQAEVQRLVRLQEAAQIRAQAREAARIEAWAEARAGIRWALAFVVLATLAVGIAIGYYGLRPPTDTISNGMAPTERRSRTGEADGTAVSPTITPWPIRVYVSGAVAEAQVVALPPGSLVADALDVAGGMTEDADRDALNLAAPLFDNQHLLVPTRHASPPGERVEEEQTALHININTATVDELQRLPSIGIRRAEDIVAYRNAHGPFLQVDDILAVLGIGPSIMEQIAPFITVGP